MPSVSHVDPNSMFAAFTDAQISMIATHLANGGTFCAYCTAGDNAILTICETEKQKNMLAQWAYSTLAHQEMGSRRNESPEALAARLQIVVDENFETFMESL